MIAFSYLFISYLFGQRLYIKIIIGILLCLLEEFIKNTRKFIINLRQNSISLYFLSIFFVFLGLKLLEVLQMRRSKD